MIASGLMLLALLTLHGVIPIHATALGPGPGGTTVVRTDSVTGTLSAQTRPVVIQPSLRLPPGTGLDAFVDPSHTPWRLYDTQVAARFEPGLPQTGRVIPIDYGSRLPHTKLVDQQGALVDLADFPGKVVIVSFIFTRCPDKNVCPAVSAKFAALTQRLDPRRFHVIEITLDPMYDSPAVLNAYAKQFGARAGSWSILTGQQHEIQNLLDRFGINSLRVSDAAFLHNDKVFLIAPSGRVADIVQTADFSPDGLAAQAKHLAGLGSNPFERWKLALVADAVALCGGSQFAGVVLLETGAFLIVAVICFIALGLAARKIWRRA